jgi:hypothetical protein
METEETPEGKSRASAALQPLLLRLPLHLQPPLLLLLPPL